MRRTSYIRWGGAVALTLVAASSGGGWATGRAAGAAVPAGTVTTVAGGVGGPAPGTSVSLLTDELCGVNSAGGNLYTDGEAIREISGQTGRLTTRAGTIESPGAGNGKLAKNAGLYSCGTATDSQGNLVFADRDTHEIRVLATHTGTFYGRAMTTGHVYRLAGTGVAGVGESGVPALQEPLYTPKDVLIDPAGNLVFSDAGTKTPSPAAGGLIQVLAESTGTFYGIAMTAGDVYTIAGTGDGTGFSGDGGPATSAAIGTSLGAVTLDAAGNVLFAAAHNNRIRVVAEQTGEFYGQPMTAGDIYTVAGGGYRALADGVAATHAKLETPTGIAVDSNGNLVLTANGQQKVVVLATSTGTYYGIAMTAGDLYVVAGGGQQLPDSGGPATGALLPDPTGVAVDGAGNLAIADDDLVQVVAEQTGEFYGQSMTAGDIYTVAGKWSGDFFCCDDHPATSAQIFGPTGLAAGSDGSLLISDTYNQRIRLVAAHTGEYFGQAMTAGNIYTIAGTGLAGFSGNTHLATQARLNYPAGLAVDAAGNVIVADGYNNRIRVIAAQTGTFYGQAMTAGHIYTIAGTGGHGDSGNGGPARKAVLNSPTGLAVDAAGNVIIADTGSNQIRLIAASTGTYYGIAMTAGDIYAIAGTGHQGYSGDGGLATKADLFVPWAVTADAQGNLVIADYGNSVVRVIAAQTGEYYGQAMTADHIYTVAGTGQPGDSGNGGPGRQAALADPSSVSVDAAGNVLIADPGNNVVWALAGQTGTYYGIAMTAGDIYIVAGDGTQGYSGDGGPATRADFDSPVDVLATAGGFLVSDQENERVRMVTGPG